MMTPQAIVADEARIKVLEERIDELEDTVQEMDERVGSRAIAHAFDGMVLDIGGFVHTAYTHIDGDGSGSGSFDRQNFELLIKANLNEQWSTFFAGGFLRESDNPFTTGSRTDPKFNSKNKNPQIIAWTNYRHNDVFNVRVGRFITPHGIINIEHFPAILLDPEQPQFLRPFSGDTLFPNFSTGLQVHGSHFLGDSMENKLQFYGYMSNFSGAPEEHIYGARTACTLASENATFGVNFASGTRANGSSYDLYGGDFLYDHEKILWKTEVFETDESIGGDRQGAYTQPAYRITDKWIAFYRYDFLDDGGSESTEHVVGLNYLPYSNVRLRGILRFHDFDTGTLPATTTTVPDADATTIQLTGTFSF